MNINDYINKWASLILEESIEQGDYESLSFESIITDETDYKKACKTLKNEFSRRLIILNENTNEEVGSIKSEFLEEQPYEKFDNKAIYFKVDIKRFLAYLYEAETKSGFRLAPKDKYSIPLLEENCGIEVKILNEQNDFTGLRITLEDYDKFSKLIGK